MLCAPYRSIGAMDDEKSKKRGSSPRHEGRHEQTADLSESLNSSSVRSSVNVSTVRKRPKVISTAINSSDANADGNEHSPSSSLSSPSPSASASTNVRVVARLRPLSSKERSEQSTEAITASVSPALASPSAKMSELTRICVEGNRHFDYDAVFAPGTTQSRVYERSVGHMVKDSIFKGYNVTILAYGQTGSGKTFTMGTASTSSVPNAEIEGVSISYTELAPPSDDDGIIPRAVYDLFSVRKNMPRGESRVVVEMSYLEIYNEEVRDLLCEDSGAATNLIIRDSRNDGVHVQNLSWEVVQSPQHVNELMEAASHRRVTASTHMNAASSRSHAICTLRVTIEPNNKKTVIEPGSNGNLPMEIEEAACCSEFDMANDGDVNVKQIRAKLTLVDLAGSERIKRTGAEGSRMKEGININKGLFVLGQVVSALSEMSQGVGPSHVHIPYRDSKLTRLLQDSLGGNSRTIMVACVSPADSNIEESVNTLRYAQRARNVKNSAIQNVVSASLSPEEAALLRQENHRLQLRVEELEKEIQQKRPTAATACHSTGGTPASSIGENTSNNANLEDMFFEQLDHTTALRAKCATYVSTIESLKKQAEAAAEDALAASLNADRAQLKMERLQKLISANGINIPPDGDGEEQSAVAQMRTEITDLKNQLHEARTDAMVARTMAASIVASKGDLASAERSTHSEHEGNMPEADEVDEMGVDESLTSELVAVSGEIEQKEELAKRANKERECMNAMRSHFEVALVNLQEEVETLTTEKAKLFEKISQQGVRSGKKASEEMSKRIDELEMRIRDLKAKVADYKKTLRLREKAEQKCAQLAAEITKDKCRRAELQRRLKEESMERRQEKKAARIEATRLLRNSQKLKIELEKVKRAAERQAVVLRRKAEETSNLHKRLANRQKKRIENQQPEFEALDAEHARAVESWISSEIQHAVVISQLRQQLSDQRDLLDTVLAKQHTVAVDSSAMQLLGEEIDSRRAIIAELEKKIGPRNDNDDIEETFTVRDMPAFEAFSLNEVKAAFFIVLEQLVASRVEHEVVQANYDLKIGAAVGAAVSKERAAGKEAIMKLKLQHSEIMTSLMESTAGAVGFNMRESVNSEGVDAKLLSFLDQCSKVKETVSADLRDMRQQRDEMQETMDFVANGIKMAKKKKSPKPRVSFTNQSFMMDDDDAAAPEFYEEDSDDSDWSPETPAYKIRIPTPTFQDGPEQAESMPPIKQPRSRQHFVGRVVKSDKNVPDLLDSKETELTESSINKENDVVDYSQMRVVELKKILRTHGLAVSGKKAQLVERLEDHYRSSSSTFASSKPDKIDENSKSELSQTDNIEENSASSDDKENHGKTTATRRRSNRKAVLGDSSNNRKRAPPEDAVGKNPREPYMKDTMTSAAKRAHRLSPSSTTAIMMTASAKKRKRDMALQAINNAEQQLLKVGRASSDVPTASAKKRKRDDALKAITNAEMEFSKLGGSL